MKITLALVLPLILAAAAAEPAFMPELRVPPEPAPPALRSVLAAENGKDVSQAKDWPARRAELLRAWRDVIGPFPQRTPLESRVLSTETLADHTRTLVRYRTEADSTCDAYVLIPKAERPKTGWPGVVVLHQTSRTNLRDPVGLDGRESVHIALHLVRRGYVCVAPRNFLWALEGKSYEQAAKAVLAEGKWKTGMAKMTWDAIRATDVLLEQPGVDPQRVGTIGHSLGGKEVLYHAAFDERVKAAVSCEGGVGISFSNWDAPWYLGPQVKSKGFCQDHHGLIALVAPRALLVIGGESADGAQSWPFIEANLPLWRLLSAGDRLGLLRHKHGHDFPPPGEDRQRVYRWLDHWLATDASSSSR